jgi:hypothetical protein
MDSNIDLQQTVPFTCSKSFLFLIFPSGLFVTTACPHTAGCEGIPSKEQQQTADKV